MTKPNQNTKLYSMQIAQGANQSIETSPDHPIQFQGTNNGVHQYTNKYNKGITK